MTNPSTRAGLALCAAPILYAVFYRRRVMSVCVCVLATLLPVLSVFFIWGSLMTPSPVRVHQGLSCAHVVLSLGYAALFMLLLAPRFDHHD